MLAARFGEAHVVLSIWRLNSRLSWLLQRTSLLTQLLHSGTSFLLMAGMARLAPSHAFALAAAFFLLVTLCSSLNVYVLSAAWLRTESLDASRRLQRFALVLALVSAVAFALFWLAYRGWAFGAAPLLEVLMVGAAAFAYLLFFARRRQLLLEGHFVVATLADGMRSLLVVCIAGVTVLQHESLEFSRFLTIFVFAHGLGMLPMVFWQIPLRAAAPPESSWWRYALSPALHIRRGDWMSVASGVANVLFSQSASLLAPILISANEYATLRAYELFLFPVFFTAQILDPICLRHFRVMPAVARRSRKLVFSIVGPGLLIFAPLALICLATCLSKPLEDLLQTLIAPAYRSAFWLMTLVLGLSSLISFNAPLRWYFTVIGHGKPLIIGTALGIAASLTTLLTLSHLHNAAWVVLVSKILYEAVMAVVGAWGVASFWRSTR